MGLRAAKCSECGAQLEIDDSREFGYCSRCGTKYMTEKITSYTTTNVEHQVNVYLGENNFEIEKKQCDVLIKCLEEKDFHICKSLSLKILEKNPENQLANMVYKCNFEIVEDSDYAYSAVNFNFQPITSYFESNNGLISAEFSSLILNLIKSSYPNTAGLNRCLESLFSNIENLKCEKEDVLKFFISAKDFYIEKSTLKFLETQLSKTRGAGLKTFLFTDNEYLAAQMDELRAGLKNLTKSLKSYQEELVNFINKKYLETKRLSEEDREKIEEKEKKLNEVLKENNSQGCYIATSVYGSYDCPEVWILRRYRDYKLASSWAGRLFIKVYYALSPTLVKWFGNKSWFKKFWKHKLDKKIAKLHIAGYEDTEYEDIDWNKKANQKH